jgi:peptidoglycan/LPS O-acetylase OafA/YrhL
MAAPYTAVATPPQGDARVQWLDGIRGAAATFVVVHHIWLTAWPSEAPINPGPWWLGWLLYGHMAVATFIVVSGFSLALAPMRKGGTLSGGVRRFLRRRAWRILPAYWAALILSIVLTALFLQPNLGSGAIAKTTAVYGLLLQDAVGSANPNHALWSIAVEWQIYFLFPLILLLGRRTSIVTGVSITVVVVILAHAAAGLGGLLDKINGLTPQFLGLFALGVLAVWIGTDDRAERLRRPLAGVAVGALGAFVLLAATHGSEWVVAKFFWMDLLFGAGVASLLALMYAGWVVPARRVLTSRALMFLGLFSYSIYLIHEPIVNVLNKYVFGAMGVSPLATFALSIAFGLPAVLALCYGFHLLFEAPFLHNRGWSALRTMPVVRWWTRRGRRAEQQPAPVEELHDPSIVTSPKPVIEEKAAG